MAGTYTVSTFYSADPMRGASRLAGFAAAAVMTLAGGYALTSGFARDVVAFVQPLTEMAVLPPPATDEPQPRELTERIDVNLDRPRLITPEFPTFTPEAGERIVAEPSPGTTAAPSTFTRPAPAAEPKRIAPKLRPGEQPPYPPSEVRAGHEGVTTLAVCVTAHGRVSSASVAQTSGHMRLDDAALKWVRNARFTPGASDSSATAVCGHAVAYEWVIETTRR